MSDGSLSDVRVLDLAAYGGEIAGRMLADLGADVIKIEEPAGTASRRRGPFDAEDCSLFWAAYGRGKSSVVVDQATPGGREALDELFARSDIVFANEEGGEVVARHPHLIWVAITPFGLTGPLSDAPATDLTLEAAGGLLALQGDGDRAPVPVGYPQAFLHAGAQAAADALIALHERARSGLGQELDVSTQAAMVWTLMNAFGWAMLLGTDVPGTCDRRDETLELVPGIEPPMPREPVWKTADGYAVVTLQLPLIGERTLQKLVDWATAEGELSDDLAGRSWLDWRTELRAGELAREPADRLMVELQAFIAGQTNAAVQEFAVREAVTVAAIHTLVDVLSDPHLDARSFWHEAGGLTYPSEWVRLSATPVQPPRPAPTVGADDHRLDEIRREPARPRPALPATTFERGRSTGLADVKVADFGWVGVGPLIAKAFADHGAELVHIESSTRLDVLRKLPPMADAEPGTNRSQFFAMMNTSKRSMALNLATPEGKEIARELIDWADVVVESFTPGTMARLGFDYETVAADHPDLVMLSTCLRGQFGPEQSFAGFGNQGASMTGLLAVTGWPDRPPSGPWGAYTDFITPRFGVSAALAALHHRDRTGQGQHIDLAQIEAGIQFIEPKLLQAQIGDVPLEPVGHLSDHACPHGVFPTADGRHLAVAIESPGQWRALAAAAGLNAFEGHAFDQLAARAEHRVAIEAALAEWCGQRDARGGEDELRAAGVPVSVVAFPSELVADPQLAHREFFTFVDHPEIGPAPMEGHVTAFSATPPSILRPAPLLGEHTDELLAEILGLDETRIAALRASGALD